MLNYVPINIIANNLNDEDVDWVIEEIINHKDFKKSNIQIEIYKSIENLKYPQEYENGGLTILDDLNERERNDHRVQAMYKKSRYNNLSLFIISQENCELPTRTIPANGYIYHIFKTNIFRYNQNLYQDKASMDMTLDEFKFLTRTCWDLKNQPPTIDMIKDKYTGRYRLGLNSLFVRNSSAFKLTKWIFILMWLKQI